MSQQHSEMISRRTAGDGMESDSNVVEPLSKSDSASIRLSNTGPKKDKLLPGRLIQVYPTGIIKNESKKPLNYSKPQKFVPYEPYTAAVKPIVPNSLNKEKKSVSKNNMDLNLLVSQMSQMDTKISEYKPRAKLISLGDKSLFPNNKSESPINEELQKKNEDLVKENEQLKEQLKQQVQVNKELKTMLVASMGEDLETQVNSLNEDKKHLANALINSAQHLTTHQEQTEWLAGQCEVWRSKFLASSLMVEELANWKKILSERTDSLQQAIKLLLEERCRAREMMLYTYKNIYSLHEKWLQDISILDCEDDRKLYKQPIGNITINTTLPQSSNILDLASVMLKLSENISGSVEKQDVSPITTLPSLTEAEKNAENVMAMPIEVLRVNEVSVNALVNHAYSRSEHTPRPIASCLHCNGKVQLL